MSQAVEPLLPKHVEVNLMCSWCWEGSAAEGDRESLGLAGQPVLPIPQLKVQREPVLKTEAEQKALDVDLWPLYPWAHALAHIHITQTHKHVHTANTT